MNAAQPELRFRLVGEWHPLLIPGATPRDLVARYVKHVTGVRDDLAALRAVLSRQLEAVVDAASEGRITAMLMMTNLTKDVQLPVVLTVISKPELRMSPALGTATGTVIDVLEESFRQLERPGFDTALRLTTADSEALRLHSFSVQQPEFTDDDRAGSDPVVLAEAEQMSVRALTAEYWCAVPSSKNVVLVNLTTPLGDIPHIMLDLFDSIVKASYFEKTAVDAVAEADQAAAS